MKWTKEEQVCVELRQQVKDLREQLSEKRIVINEIHRNEIETDKKRREEFEILNEQLQNLNKTNTFLTVETEELHEKIAELGKESELSKEKSERFVVLLPKTFQSGHTTADSSSGSSVFTDNHMELQPLYSELNLNQSVVELRLRPGFSFFFFSVFDGDRTRYVFQLRFNVLPNCVNESGLL